MTNILDNLAKEVDKISENEADSLKQESSGKEKKAEETSLMASLLPDDKIPLPRAGDVIEGRVIEIGTNIIYLDIEPLGTGVVLGREMKDGMRTGKIRIGDYVTATITELENEDGYIELSIREASHGKAWEDLESKRDTQEKMATRVLSANKGGLLVEINGISGFLPVSQLSAKNYPRVEDGDKNKILSILKKLVGQELEVRILDADRETQKLIVSEKAAQKEKDREIISSLQIGDTIAGEISGVVDFGAFIKFLTPGKNEENAGDEDRLEGLVHISELAWQLIENPRDIVKVGQKVKAQIIGIDNDKISLSIRSLEKDPWLQISEKYKMGDIVKGTVNKINHFGAFVYLDKDIHGLAHVSEMSEMYPGKNVGELIEVGKAYEWKILSIEPKEHRMGLALIVGGKKASGKKEKEENKEEAKKEEASKKTDTGEKKPKKEKAGKEKVKKEEKPSKAKKEKSEKKDKKEGK